MTSIFVLGVIVTYHPEPATLNKLVESLSSQVHELIIIDNASSKFPAQPLNNDRRIKPKIILNRENLGLAAAYNQAIDYAKTAKATHIILFDQDSLPAGNMVNHLLQAMLQYNQHSLIAAIAGPKYTDIKGQRMSPFVRIKGFHLERVACADGDVVEIDHLISSGSLIDIRAIDRAGDFIEGLFIDYVDTEWCLRARHHGLKILGVGNAAMQHNIGDTYLNVLGRQLPMHSPLRLQYQFRNQIWLIKQPLTSWKWRIIDSIRCIKLIVVYMFFAPKKLKSLNAIAKGIFHGITNRMGKL